MKAVLVLCLVVFHVVLAGNSSNERDRELRKYKDEKSVLIKEEYNQKQSHYGKSNVNETVKRNEKKSLKITKEPVTEAPLRKRNVDNWNDYHLDVFRLSNGLQAVALDDSSGHVVDYLYLPNNIQLVPLKGSYILPATDLLDGQKTFVNLATVNGHLSLSEAMIGNIMYHGFQGFNIDGRPVLVPVEKSKYGLVVRPVVYKMDMLNLYSPASTTRLKTYQPPAA